MQNWNLTDLERAPHSPRILSSTQDARTIVLDLPAGERLQDHEVHERAFVLLISGEVQITATKSQDAVTGGPGLLVEFDPRERHEVLAHTDARLLLLLTPWPAPGHPGALTLDEKADVRERAAEHPPGASAP